VLPAYRTSATISLLWRGIADYLALHDIGLMFGCASFPGIDPTRTRRRCPTSITSASRQTTSGLPCFPARASRSNGCRAAAMTSGARWCSCRR
jgi:putative hemolysin